jgi:hypothetical protein
MKKFLVFVVILLGFSAMAMAQELPRAEVYGGYAFFACDNAAFGVRGGSSCLYQGWNGSIKINGNKWIGFTADVGGYYDRGVTGKVERNSYSFLVGPVVSVHMGKVTTFYRALFGDAYVYPGLYWPYDNSLAMALGGGVDVSINNRFSIRPVQLEYMPVKSGKPLSDNLRFSAGFIYKFGKLPK